MNLKKDFKMPEIEVIQFDTKDVITLSNNKTLSVDGSYDMDSIRNIFNYKY